MRQLFHLPQRLSRRQRRTQFALAVLIASLSGEAFAQYRYSTHTYNQPLYQSSGRSYFPSPPRCSSIRFGCGYCGGNGSALGTPAFSAVHGITYTIRGDGVLRLADHRYMFEFFEDEPNALYTITLNNAYGTNVEYRHDPDALDWKQRLTDAINQRAPSIPKVPSESKETVSGDSPKASGG